MIKSKKDKPWMGLNCMKGDAAETILLAELVIRGFNVSIPIGQDNLYDLVVEGRNGSLYKIQVKSIQTLQSNNSAQVSYVRKYIGNIDYLAVLIIDTWFFFTEEYLRINSNKNHLTVNAVKLDVKFRENFEIFK